MRCRPPDKRQCLCQASILAPDQPEQVERIRLVRLDGQDGLVERRRLADPAGLVVDDGLFQHRTETERTLRYAPLLRGGGGDAGPTVSSARPSRALRVRGG